MTDNKTESNDKKAIVKKSSPFGGDPYNKRGGKGGGKGAFSSGGNNVAPKGKSISVPRFNGGSGGDR